ncbi:hypothetical protein Srot_0350 [Segniliparus rotundus DSM 44985]|uniref:Uncharacterized protein n=1 Tax=Segniliparus rotundus (strain ATCC BAA-972 / CDC 1076 / CIP 108378 / DSM 44985 / JCM 13578) TaxID=640132 RepID=D6ZB78_SEGRD|nr:hypothetical protein [Segniliparus rotundus]ADG96837.1 hypothetical protein Srot_0350 [Segniliparus rotundus DSM 44985]
MSKAEKSITWTLWALLLIASTAVGVFGLVIGTIDVVLVIIGAANGQDVDGWASLAWYFVCGALLVALPWSILGAVVAMARRRKRVWFWPVAALGVVVLLASGLGRMCGVL